MDLTQKIKSQSIRTVYVSDVTATQDHIERIPEVEKKIVGTNGWNSENSDLSIETKLGSRTWGNLENVEDYIVTLDQWTLPHFIHWNMRNGTLKLIGIHKNKWPKQGESYNGKAQQSFLFEYQGVRFAMVIPTFKYAEFMKNFKSVAACFVNLIYLDSKMKLPPYLFLDRSRIWLNTSRSLVPSFSPFLSQTCESEKSLESQDTRNYFPVSGYLLLIWKAFAKLRNLPFDQTPIVLEKLNIFGGLTLPRNGKPVHFQVKIVKKTGNFNIRSENFLLVRGTVRSLHSETKNGIKSLFVTPLKSNRGKPEIELEWNENWMDFYDSLLQILISNDHQESQILPTCGHLDSVIIDPKTFLNSVQSNLSSSVKTVPVHREKNFCHSFTVSCEGIQFQGWKYRNDFTTNDYSVVLENIPYKDSPSVVDRNSDTGTLYQIMKEKRDTRDLKIISNIFRAEEKTQLRKSLQNLIIVNKETDIFSSSSSQSDLSPKRETVTSLFNTFPPNGNCSNSNSNSSISKDIPNCSTISIDSLDKTCNESVISNVSNEHQSARDEKITVIIDTENTEESKIVESTLPSPSSFSFSLSRIQPSFSYITHLFVLCTIGVLCTLSLFFRTGIQLCFKLFKQSDKIKLMNSRSVDEQSNISITMKCSGDFVPFKMYEVLQGLVRSNDHNLGNDGNFLSWRIEKGLFFNYWKKDQNFDVKNHIFLMETSNSGENNMDLDHEVLKTSEFYSNHKWWSKSNQGQAVTTKPQWECRIMHPQNSTNFLIYFVAHSSYGNTVFFTNVIQKALNRFDDRNPEIYAIYPVLEHDSLAHGENNGREIEDKNRNKGQIESCGQRLFSRVISTLVQVHSTILEMSQVQKVTKFKDARKDTDGNVAEFILKESQIKSSVIANCLSKAFKKVFVATRRNSNNFNGEEQLNKNENEEELPLKFLTVQKQLSFPHQIDKNLWISTNIIPSLANPFRNLVNFLLPNVFSGIPKKTMIIFSKGHETVGCIINSEERSVTLCVLDENQTGIKQQNITEYFFHNFQKELDKIVAQSENMDIGRTRSNSHVVIPILDEQ